MGIPVKIKVDDFVYLGESFAKGDIFNAPHEAFASFLCEQEKRASRVKEGDCEPEKVGTMKRVLKSKGGNVQKENKGSYDTKVMTPDGSKNGKPVVTPKAVPKEVPKAVPKASTKAPVKSNVKATSDASSENT